MMDSRIDREGNDPETLLYRARQGDAEALSRLLELYRSYLRLFSRVQVDRCLQSKTDLSDLIQETMFIAHRSFHEFRGDTERELVAWLRQILASRLAHLIRRYQTQRRDVRLEMELGEGLDRSSLVARQLVARVRLGIACRFGAKLVGYVRTCCFVERVGVAVGCRFCLEFGAAVAEFAPQLACFQVRTEMGKGIAGKGISIVRFVAHSRIPTGFRIVLEHDRHPRSVLGSYRATPPSPPASVHPLAVQSTGHPTTPVQIRRAASRDSPMEPKM